MFTCNIFSVKTNTIVHIVLRTPGTDSATVCTVRSSYTDGGRGFFPSPKRPARLWCHPAYCPVSTRVGSLPRVKWLRRDIDHTPKFNAEIKTEWSFTSTPPIRLHAVDRTTLTCQVTLCLFYCNQNFYRFVANERRLNDEFTECAPKSRSSGDVMLFIPCIIISNLQ